MGRPTHGLAVFEQRINDGDFNHRLARSEIGYNIGEEDSPDDAAGTIRDAAEIAQHQVWTMLRMNKELIASGAKPVANGHAPLPTVGDVAQDANGVPHVCVAVGSTAAPAPAEPPKKRRGRPANPPGPQLDPTAGQSAPSTSSAAPAPAPEKDPLDGLDTSPAPTPAPSSGGDPLEEMDPEAAAPAKITDVELTAAITKKNAERLARPEDSKLPDGRDGRSPLVIRETISLFVGEGQRSSDIPQDKRATFLKRLEAL